MSAWWYEIVAARFAQLCKHVDTSHHPVSTTADTAPASWIGATRGRGSGSTTVAMYAWWEQLIYFCQALIWGKC